MSPFHLVTDLDGTWLPNQENLQALRQLEKALKSHPGSTLTFASGRSFDAVMEAIASWDLLAPDYMITDVGCALWNRTPNGGWEEDPVYIARVNERWNEAGAQKLLVSGLPVTVQQQAGVAPRRRLALEAANGAPMEVAERDLLKALKSHGMNADLLPSHDRYLDVLPAGVDKGFAVTFLQTAAGLPRPLVCCGDSANDIGMLKIADFPVLMGGGFIGLDEPGLPKERIHLTAGGGPVGIHAALRSFGLLGEVVHGY